MTSIIESNWCCKWWDASHFEPRTTASHTGNAHSWNALYIARSHVLWKLKQYDGYDNSIAEILISEVMPNHSLRQSPKIYPKPIHELQNKWQGFWRDGNLIMPNLWEKEKGNHVSSKAWLENHIIKSKSKLSHITWLY